MAEWKNEEQPSTRRPWTQRFSFLRMDENTTALSSAQVALTGNRPRQAKDAFKQDNRYFRPRNLLQSRQRGSAYYNKDVASIFKSLEEFLAMEEFDEDLQRELSQVYPDYQNLLRHRYTDLKRQDHCIVVTGELSSGKSTLINNIIGENLLKCRNVESTATICRIRNSKTRRIEVCYSKYHAKEVFDFSNYDCDAEKGSFRKTIGRFTDNQYRSVQDIESISAVDIYVPLPLLKEDTIIVDTPGIGGSKELDEKLINYIPNAIAFVFVVNASNAGGMHDDRLPVIMKHICQHYKEGKMPCFDPRDVIFVINKWDLVREEDDSDDENEITWTNIQEKIKGIWENVDEENIFRTSFKTNPEDNRKDAEILRLEKKLSEIIEKNCMSRKERHIMFLEEFMREAGRGIQTRLALLQYDDNTYWEIMQVYMKSIKRIKQDIDAALHLLESEIDVIMENLSRHLHNYIHSDAGKSDILNPPNKKPILEVSFVKIELKVRERFQSHIQQWRTGDKVRMALQILEESIQNNFGQIKKKIASLERDMTNTNRSSDRDRIIVGSSDASFYFELVAFSPIWVPLLVAAGTLCVVAGIIVSPFIIKQIKRFSKEEIKSRLVDQEYAVCIRQLPQSAIKRDLDNTYGFHYRQLVSHTLKETFSKRLSGIELTVEQLRVLRRQIVEKEIAYHQLNRHLNSIRDELLL